ncbi:MAG: dihydropteroate synthase, partial [Gemmiger sp.]
GGCCGTTPAYIAKLKETFRPLTPAQKIPLRRSCLCTPVRFVDVTGITVVGERINPTGKKRLQQALRDGDSSYPCAQAVAQAEAGAEVLDVNAGLPGIDEPATLEQLVKVLQAVTDLPLQLDSSNPQALARALRIYNGKPIVNSVNGEQSTLDKILPLCKKYGAAVVGLALDEHGIPATAEGRFAIAQRIVKAANAIGIPNEDIYIDCLTLTASAQQEGASQTLEALTLCKKELGVRTVLGISNISFGLPCRGYLNTTFLTMAMVAGLDLAIMNPNTPEMMAAVRAYRVLTSQDPQSTDYVAAYADVQIQTSQVSKSAPAAAAQDTAAPGGDALFEAVRRGLKTEARAAAEAALTIRDPLDVVNTSLIPALDVVGDGFEKGTVFLPQLLQAATAAQAAFEAIKAKIAASGQAQGSKGKIVIATVKGDVHDIGKNIVRVILENYGYDVLDLGRDVPPERVVEAVRQTGAKLVGLSALMTTTVPNMQATIEALHAAKLDCKVMVGGAVLTPSYAKDIGADYYCKDAKASADLAKQLLG